MGTIATAYVQVMPSTEGITQNLENAFGDAGESAGEKGGARAGKGFVGKLGKALIAAGALKAVTDFFKAAIDQGAQLQQNLGGTEAVFGQYAYSIQNVADKAYKNMGMSASDYMATANKMGALFQGSGMSQLESMKLSTKAMQRAADVASVMGIETSAAMEAISGAAKGNFTMMDNLGVAMNATTLQAYALEKGINFDWNTASQAEKAQLAMDMFFDRTSQYAGNFERESQQTLSGSFGMLKASWADFLGQLALGGDVTEAAKNLMSSVITVGKNLLPVLGQIGKGAWEAIKVAGQEGLAYLGPVLSEGWDKIKAGAGKAWEGVKGSIAGKWDDIKSAVSEKAAAVGGAVSGAWDSIKGAVAGAWDGIKGAVEGAVAPVVAAVSGPIESLTGTISSVWSAISSAVSGDWGPILSAIEGAVAPVVAAVSGPIDALVGTVSGVWSSIEGGVAGAWDSIKSAIETALEPIKSVFDFSWSLPKIELPSLPKISVTWQTGAFGITYPSFSWNAKAMNNPFLFSGATIFGAGEAGDEVLYGRTALMRDIRSAVADTSYAAPDNSGLLDAIDRIDRHLDRLGIYLDGNALVGGIVEGMNDALGSLDALTQRGLA